MFENLFPTSDNAKVEDPLLPIKQKVAEFTATPQGRIALAQFGVNMLQPQAFGQSFAGHFGQAVGAGGEAYRRETDKQTAAEDKARKEAMTVEDRQYSRSQDAIKNKQTDRKLSLTEKRIKASEKRSQGLSSLLRMQNSNNNKRTAYILKGIKDANAEALEPLTAEEEAALAQTLGNRYDSVFGQQQATAQPQQGAPSGPADPALGAPQAGFKTYKNGSWWQFIGGDPANASSWKVVNE
jgi:hypothetical protein